MCDTTSELYQQLIHGSLGDAKKIAAENKKRKSFTNVLNAHLQKSGKTKNQLSYETGISKSMIYAIFNGDRRASKKEILLLSYNLKLDLDQVNALLKLAKLKELYPKNVEDALIISGWKKGMSLEDIDELLAEQDCDLRFYEKDDDYAMHYKT